MSGRKLWTLLRTFIYCTISRGNPKDVLRNPGWETLTSPFDTASYSGKLGSLHASCLTVICLSTDSWGTWIITQNTMKMIVFQAMTPRNLSTLKDRQQGFFEITAYFYQTTWYQLQKALIFEFYNFLQTTKWWLCISAKYQNCWATGCL